MAVSPPPRKLTKLYSLTCVMSLLGNHMPHAPLGVFDITRVAGNDVNMDMQNTLTGRRPHVYADIVAVRIELIVQQPALLGYQLHAGLDLFGRQVEKTGDMTARDDQGMTRTHCVAITRAVG